MMIRVGCSTWSLNDAIKQLFPSDGTHLERYSQVFNSVEINSSFYRPHRHETYIKWANATPKDFRFSVKAPKQITHVKRLTDCDAELESFLAEISGLGRKMGPILFQFPPSLAWIEDRMLSFFSLLRTRTVQPVVCEPRHKSWFNAEVDKHLTSLQIARAAADPALTDAARLPAGDLAIRYYRLHGSPQMYYSAYEDNQLEVLAVKLKDTAETASCELWCVFDNTAASAAQRNAIYLSKLLERKME
jgi:uncharacterized protein YecE (DUF72 family)